VADSTANFAEKTIVALAMAMLIIAREIDLSVAATMTLCSLAMGFAMQAGADTGWMVVAALLTGLLCGFFNGWLVTRLAIPSIVVTIGTLSLYRGLAQVLLGDQAITGYPDTLVLWGNGTLADVFEDLPWLILPLECVVMLLLALVVGIYMHKSVHGRRIYAMGANATAAQFSGIDVERYRWGLFVFTGLMSAVAAVLLTGRIGSTRPNLAMGWELDIITMVILGGVSIHGGRGSITGTVLAAVLMGVFTFGLAMLNVKGIVISMFMGGMLILAMVLPRYLPRQFTHTH
jgi:rhamnose transport system permease protein